MPAKKIQIAPLKIKGKQNNAESSVSKSGRAKGLAILYSLGFILAVATAFPSYIQSSYLAQFISLEAVNAFFLVSNMATVLAIILFPRFIEKFSNYFSSKIILMIYGCALLIASLAANTWTAILSLGMIIISSNLIWINMDIFVQHFSKKTNVGQIRGIYFTVINLGWIISPYLASNLVAKADYELPLLIAAFTLLPFFLIFWHYSRQLQEKFICHEEKPSLTIKKIWRNKNLRGVFFLSLLLSLFYGIAVLYVPMHLNRNLGMAWSDLGIIFSIMLLPFIIFQIPAGIMADRRWGEKGMFAAGFVILILSLYIFYELDTTSLAVWGTVLFFSRIGASLIEAMRETYFFKIASDKDVALIDFFRLTTPLGHIVGAILALIIMAFLPLPYLFLLAAIVMLSSFGWLAIMKDIR